jgi:hypothetical protein
LRAPFLAAVFLPAALRAGFRAGFFAAAFAIDFVPLDEFQTSVFSRARPNTD